MTVKLSSPQSKETFMPVCEKCNGTGVFTCHRCSGTGTVSAASNEAVNLSAEAAAEQVKCPSCHGVGTEPCRQCDGAGEVDC